MQKRIALLKQALTWIDTNKRVIGILFSAIVALVGVETATVQPVFSESVNDVTTRMVETARDWAT